MHKLDLLDSKGLPFLFLHSILTTDCHLCTRFLQLTSSQSEGNLQVALSGRREGTSQKPRIRSRQWCISRHPQRPEKYSMWGSTRGEIHHCENRFVCFRNITLDGSWRMLSMPASWMLQFCNFLSHRRLKNMMYYNPVTVKKSIKKKNEENTGNVKLKKKKRISPKKEEVLDNARFDTLIWNKLRNALFVINFTVLVNYFLAIRKNERFLRPEGLVLRAFRQNNRSLLFQRDPWIYHCSYFLVTEWTRSLWHWNAWQNKTTKNQSHSSKSGT